MFSFPACSTSPFWSDSNVGDESPVRAIDPLGRYLVTRGEDPRYLRFVEISTGKTVHEARLSSPPDREGAESWYQDGAVVLHVPLRGRAELGRIRLYEWEVMEPLQLESEAVSLKTHASSPYLWIISRDGAVRAVRPVKGGKSVTLPGRYAGAGEPFFVEAGRSVRLLDPGTGKPALFDAASLQPVEGTPGSNASRAADSPAPLVGLGGRVFAAKCWGCHHVRREAFGPPFEWIGKTRSPEWIRAQLADPESTSKALGYRKNAMPRIPLTEAETEGLVGLIEAAGRGEATYIE